MLSTAIGQARRFPLSAPSVRSLIALEFGLLQIPMDFVIDDDCLSAGNGFMELGHCEGGLADDPCIYHCRPP